MQLGNAFQGQKCARCRHAIQSDPAFADTLWYHRTCLEEGTRALRRAQELAAASVLSRRTPAPRRRQEASSLRDSGADTTDPRHQRNT
jgi:hypothetical protein